MNTLLKASAAMFLGMSAPTGDAMASIMWSNTALSYDRLVNFESAGVLATNTTVTTQFSALGVVFSGSIRANPCGYNANSAIVTFSGNSLSTIDTGCSSNHTDNAFSIHFASDIAGLSLDMNSSGPGDIFELRNNGQLVTRFIAGLLATNLPPGSSFGPGGGEFYNDDVNHYGMAGYLNIVGFQFDEFRYVGNETHNGNIYLDNLRIQDVPEPHAIFLLGLGLAGLGMLRLRRT